MRVRCYRLCSRFGVVPGLSVQTRFRGSDMKATATYLPLGHLIALCAAREVMDQFWEGDEDPPLRWYEDACEVLRAWGWS